MEENKVQETNEHDFIFMDLQDVANYLGVHINTVYKYIKDKQNPLPTFIISKKTIRVKKEELDKWLEGYKNEKNTK